MSHLQRIYELARSHSRRQRMTKLPPWVAAAFLCRRGQYQTNEEAPPIRTVRGFDVGVV